VKLLTATVGGTLAVASSIELEGGAALPPDINIGGHGKVYFRANQNVSGAAANGTIRIVGKRISIPGEAARINFHQGQVETDLKTGGIKGVCWLLISVVDGVAVDASDRFPGWASPTDGPWFIAHYDWTTEVWTAFDNTGADFPFEPSDDDTLIARVVRRSDASPGIEKLKLVAPNTTGVAPDYAAVLAAPDDAGLTVEGVASLAKDGIVRPRLHVASDEERSDADLYVRWRPAAGDYPGSEISDDFAGDVYQLDEGATDPETQWVNTRRPLKGTHPEGWFGGFDGGEVVDVGVQWRETDDAGEVSPWVQVANVLIEGDTAAPGPVIDATVALKRGVPRVKWGNPADTDLRRANWRRGTTTVFADATPLTTPGGAEHFDDPDAPVGTPVYYFGTTEDASGNEDLGAYVMVGPITATGIRGSDRDQTPPATPSVAPSLSQTLIVGSDGVPRIRLVASITTPGDADEILWALQRDGGGFETDRGAATPTTTLRTWVVNVGEVCQLKYKSIGDLGIKGAAYSPTATKTITGDTTAPGTVDVSSATGKRPADGTIVLRDFVYPADADVAGVIFQSSVLGTFADAQFAGHQNYPKTSFRDERNLVIGQPLTYRVAAYDRSGNVGAWSVFSFTVAARYVDGGDIDVGAVNPRIHLKGNMKSGQTLELSTGGVVPLAASVFVTNVSDGDHIGFPVDYGAPPQIAFNLPGGLPTPTSGTIYQATPVSLTSSGCDVSIKQVTPGTPTVRTTGAGAGDAAVPQPRGVQGFSVSRGVLAGPYNNFYRVRLNLSFTVIDAGSGGVAVIRVYRYDGASWTPLADLTFSAAGNNSWTGNATVGFLYSGTLASSDKIGVNVLSLGDNTATCVINTFTEVFWKSRTDTSPTTATPNGEEVQVIVFPPNPAA
jgi:hypothetical protein